MLQLGPLKVVPLSLINEKWTGLALPQDQFDSLVQKGKLYGDTDWTVFFSLACLSLSQVGCFSFSRGFWLALFNASSIRDVVGKIMWG